ncbi:MAG: thioredoxin family protein [Candidatus Thorarchaeota archaeon]|nr:thioredoxin family protein [Candidatus Thorarchaeota archaeon]
MTHRNRTRNWLDNSQIDESQKRRNAIKITIFTSDHCGFCNHAVELVKEATRDLSYGADIFEVVESRIETHLNRIESEGIIAVPTIMVGKSRIIGIPKLEDVRDLIHGAMLTHRVDDT